MYEWWVFGLAATVCSLDCWWMLLSAQRPALEQARTRGGVEAVVTELVDVVTNITTWVAVQANTVDVGDFDFTVSYRACCLCIRFLPSHNAVCCMTVLVLLDGVLV